MGRHLVNRLIAASAFSLLTFSSASAFDSEGKYAVLGFGTKSCGVWLKERKSELIYTSWITGYLSAVNEYHWSEGKDLFEGIDLDGIQAWIDKYCRENPLDKISRAASKLVSEVKDRQSGQAPTRYRPLPALPEPEAATNQTDRPEVTPEAERGQLPTPGVLSSRAGRRIARLRIQTSEGLVYYVKLYRNDPRQPAMTMLAVGGMPFETKVPLGSYRM